MGSSIGLDRPLYATATVIHWERGNRSAALSFTFIIYIHPHASRRPYILNDVKAQLDPTNRVLTNWNTSFSLQPCTYGGPAGRMATGVAWLGIACSDFNTTMPGITISLAGRTLNGTIAQQVRFVASSNVLAAMLPPRVCLTHH